MIAEKNIEILPLFSFFERLREHQFPLGIGEYQLLLTALQFGFGANKQEGVFYKDKLFHLCKLLWFKPGQSLQVFEELFQSTYFFDTNIPEIKEDAEDNQPKNTTQSDPSNPQENEEISTPHEPISGFENDEKSDILEKNDPENHSIAVRLAIGQNHKGKDLEIDNDQKIDLEKSKFLFFKNFYPVDQRKIQQNLKAFPSFNYVGHTQNLDIEATVNRNLEIGHFQEVIYQRNKVNTNNLLFLIDHQGSMIAFDRLADLLKAQIGKVLKSNFNDKNSINLDAFYFYNLPKKYLYLNKGHTKFAETNTIINKIKNKKTSIVILSDAGAARGGYSKKRISDTKSFLSKLQKCTHKIVWLNPMPKERWEDTSAEDISQFVAMFEATENGIRSTVLHLKGSINVKIAI
jgi:uncharacterized protein with von Willebrand factor type A (vWA) domain